MNKCPSCGKPTDPGAAFCGNCGQPLTVQQAPTVSAPTAEQPAATQQSPIVQVLENQQPSTAPMPNNMAPAVAGAAAIPAYAKEYADPEARKGEIMATIGLICGVVAIPAALFYPLLAFVLGGAGIVLGTIGRSKYKHTLSIMAIIFPVIGILAGFAAFGIAASTSSATNLAQGKSASSANMVMVDTPCYSVRIDGGLKNYTPSSCNFDAASTSEEFTVNAIYNPNITSANLDQVAPGIFQQAIAKAGDTFVSGGPGTFANDPAYIIYANNAAGDSKGIFAMVVHQSAGSGDNVYFVGRVIRTTYTPVFGPMESNWQWK